MHRISLFILSHVKAVSHVNCYSENRNVTNIENYLRDVDIQFSRESLQSNVLNSITVFKTFHL